MNERTHTVAMKEWHFFASDHNQIRTTAADYDFYDTYFFFLVRIYILYEPLNALLYVITNYLL